MSAEKRKILNDIILAGCALLLALSVFLVVRLLSKEGALAVIRVHGKEVAALSLSENGEYVIDGKNTVVVLDGAAYMKYASCPDSLCIRQGKKHRSGERIICLPNRVEVEIRAEGERIH